MQQTYPVPPDDHVAYLKANPDRAESFDRKYGPGASTRYLPAAEPTMLDRAQAVASDIGAGFMEAPGAIASGIGKAANATLDLTAEAGAAIDRALPVGSLQIGAAAPNGVVGWEEGASPESDIRIPEAALQAIEPDSTTGTIVEGTAQFLTGFLGAGKLLRGWQTVSKAAVAGKAAVKGFMADYAVFDPQEGNLANLADQYPALQGPLTDFLKADPDDTTFDNRFRSALIGLGLGTAADGMVLAVRSMKLAKAGRVQEAAKAADAAEAAYRGSPEDQNMRDFGTPGGDLAGDRLRQAAEEAQMELPLRGGEGVPPMDSGPHGGLQRIVSFTEDQANYLRTWASREALRPEGIDFNLSNIEGPQDLFRIINGMSVTIRDELVKAKGGNAAGVRTWDDVRESAEALADMFRQDPHTVIARMASQTEDRFRLDAELLAYRAIMANAGENVRRYANRLEVGDYTPEDFQGFLKAAQAHASITAMVKSQQTNLGRAMNAMKMGARVDPSLVQALDNVDLSTLSEAQGRALAKKIAAAETDEAMVRLMEGDALAKIVNGHNEYWINAILSGPKTHAINMTSNLANSLLYPMEDMLAGAILRNPAKVREAGRQYLGMALALKESVQMAGKALRRADNILDPANKKLDGETFRPAITSDREDLLGSAIRGLGTVVRMPTRLLTAEDELMKQMVYRGKVYAEAVEQGRAAGHRGTALQRFVSARMDAAVDRFGRATNQAALQRSREVTFTQDLLPGTFGHTVQGVVNDHPALRMILPFVRTPTNILRFVGHRTPGLNLLYRQQRADIMAGGERRAQVLARMGTGAALWGTAVSLAAEGRITGGGPENPQVRQRMIEAGWQPYSIVTYKDDGTPVYTSYGRGDPFATFLGLAADMAEIGGQAEQSAWEDLAMAGVMALAHNVANKTYLQGLTEALDAFSQPDRHMAHFFESRAGSYVPSGVGTLKDDEYLREVNGMLQAIRSRLPGYSQELDPRRNFLGEPVNVPAGFGPDWLSPFAYSEFKNEAVKTELARLAMVHEGGFRQPRPERYGVDLREIAMPASSGLPGTNHRQSAFDRWLELTGTLRVGGRTLKETLEAVIQSDAYYRLSDGDADFSGGRLIAVQRIVEQYRKAAEVQLWRENPAVHQAYREWKLNQARARTIGVQ